MTNRAVIGTRQRGVKLEKLPAVSADVSKSQSLCVSCGFCCNGVLFRDVELQAVDSPEKLRGLGVPATQPRTAGRIPVVPQPCVALGSNCRCRIYADRPSRCREFDCALLQSFQAGAIDEKSALKTIRATRQRVEVILLLLRELGEVDEAAPLSRRFGRVKKLVEGTRAGERGIPEDPEAREAWLEKYGQLAMAVHDLQFALRIAFYPDSGN